MKYEINIEIERTTIIVNQQPNTSNVEEHNEAIEIEAKEIANETDCKTVKKLKNKEQKICGDLK